MKNNLPLAASAILPTFALIGGFLGAGKSSLIRGLAERAHQQGLRCGIVTNDQGAGLVDTALGKSTGMAVEEIPGGCFCCRADALVSALQKMSETERPDVYLAEPVGSCTDLVATVLRPLAEIYKLPLRLAPMVVVVDAMRFRDDFAGGRKRNKGKGFGKGVRYIWLKQLEEAEVIVLNKMDALKEGDAAKLHAKIQADWPGKKVVLASTRTGEGLEALWKLITETLTVPRPAMEVDYAVYGAGEAELGWLNATFAADWAHPVRMDAFLLRAAALLQTCVENGEAELAHLKLAMTSDGNAELAVVQSVQNGIAAQVSSVAVAEVIAGLVNVNLRAEADPLQLEAAFQEMLEALNAKGVKTRITDLQAFRPGQPNPTHRVGGFGRTTMDPNLTLTCVESEPLAPTTTQA